MPGITDAQLVRMREQFFDGPLRARKLSRFWVLLILAAVIASGGVAADATATVIGAMIVAPLMQPIIGIVLAIAVADRLNLGRSLLLVVGGAALVIALGYLFGLFTPVPVTAATSSQVAGRISPGLIDLAVALATGAVGAFALVRDDVADTLPGVAIAISLVPPLAVVGLTLEAGAGREAFGAFLLFSTNVAAILLSGLVVMAIYRVPHAASETHSTKPVRRRTAVLAVLVMVVAVALPLTARTVRVTQQTLQRSQTSDVLERWAGAANWRLLGVDDLEGTLVARLSGPPPSPDAALLRQELDEAGLADLGLTLELVPEERVVVPGGETGGR